MLEDDTMTEAALQENVTDVAPHKELRMECFKSEKPVIYCTGSAFARKRISPQYYSPNGAQ